jgi:hypothetical protein
MQESFKHGAYIHDDLGSNEEEKQDPDFLPWKLVSLLGL